MRFEDAVTSGSHAAFLDAFASKTRWYQPAPRAAAVQALLPWALLDGLISNSLVPADRLRVAVNGNDLPAATFSDGNRLRVDVVQGLATQGATLIVCDIGELVADIGELASLMERDLRCCVHVNCYLTFGTVSAFIPHHDAHDVLILQIHGTKRWRSFGSPVPYPLHGGRPPVDRAPEWEGRMTPGDLLYLPRGEIHATVPESLPSVHLTMGITETTGVDFLRWLAARATNTQALRRDLGATLSGPVRAARSREFGVAMRELLDHASIHEFFEDQDRERALRPLASLGAGRGGCGRFQPEMHLISALRRRLDLSPSLEAEVQVTFGKQKTRLSQLARRVLGEITARHRITVGALAAALELDAGDRDFVVCLEDLAGKSLIAIVS